MNLQAIQQALLWAYEEKEPFADVSEADKLTIILRGETTTHFVHETARPVLHALYYLDRFKVVPEAPPEWVTAHTCRTTKMLEEMMGAAHSLHDGGLGLCAYKFMSYKKMRRRNIIAVLAVLAHETKLLKEHSPASKKRIANGMTKRISGDILAHIEELSGQAMVKDLVYKFLIANNDFAALVKWTPVDDLIDLILEVGTSDWCKLVRLISDEAERREARLALAIRTYGEYMLDEYVGLHGIPRNAALRQIAMKKRADDGTKEYLMRRNALKSSGDHGALVISSLQRGWHVPQADIQRFVGEMEPKVADMDMLVPLLARAHVKITEDALMLDVLAEHLVSPSCDPTHPALVQALLEKKATTKLIDKMVYRAIPPYPAGMKASPSRLQARRHLAVLTSLSPGKAHAYDAISFLYGYISLEDAMARADTPYRALYALNEETMSRPNDKDDFCLKMTWVCQHPEDVDMFPDVKFALETVQSIAPHNVSMLKAGVLWKMGAVRAASVIAVLCTYSGQDPFGLPWDPFQWLEENPSPITEVIERRAREFMSPEKYHWHLPIQPIITILQRGVKEMGKDLSTLSEALRFPSSDISLLGVLVGELPTRDRFEDISGSAVWYCVQNDAPPPDMPDDAIQVIVDMLLTSLVSAFAKLRVRGGMYFIRGAMDRLPKSFIKSRIPSALEACKGVAARLVLVGVLLSMYERLKDDEEVTRWFLESTFSKKYANELIGRGMDRSLLYHPCIICMEESVNAEKRCKHDCTGRICRDCWREWERTKGTCPTCRR